MYFWCTFQIVQFRTWSIMPRLLFCIYFFHNHFLVNSLYLFMYNHVEKYIDLYNIQLTVDGKLCVSFEHFIGENKVYSGIDTEYGKPLTIWSTIPILDIIKCCHKLQCFLHPALVCSQVKLLLSSCILVKFEHVFKRLKSICHSVNILSLLSC